MSRWTIAIIVGLGGALAGVAGAADKPVDQDTIISVKPAIPEAVKRAMEQEQKQAKASRGGWFQKKPPPQGGYAYVPPPPARQSVWGGWFQRKPAPAKPSSGKSVWDIFNPAKWGKGKQQTPDAGQQQLQNQIQQQKLPATWNQQGGAQPATPGQMPPPNITSPTSQPG